MIEFVNIGACKGAGLPAPFSFILSQIMQPTVLIIEDDLKIADLLQLYLEKENFRVIQAHEGPEGLDLALKVKPSVLILDRMLPGMEGLDVLKQLRLSTELPVLILSAKSDELEKILGLELGADD